MKYLVSLCVCFCLLSLSLSAQDNKPVGIGVKTPDPRALLHLESKDKALYLPRLTTAERNAQTGWKAGMMIYNITENCIQQFNGTAWKCLGDLSVAAIDTLAWKLKGNAGTDTSVNFIGTTDNKPLIIKTNNVRTGFISQDNIALGAGSLPAPIPAIVTNNVVLGNNSMNKLASGSGNVSLGTSNFSNSIIGNSNIGIGNYVLMSTNVGAKNIGLGDYALTSIFGGTNNLAVGDYALTKNTTGGYNLAIGAYTLYNNTVGTDNLAMGNRALANNITGTSNLAFGAYALNKNTSGKDNLAIGNNALLENITGTFNVAVGAYALKKNSGSSNLAIGNNALQENTTGTFNVAVGDKAGANITTGAYNLMFGPNTAASSDVASYEMNIGNVLYGTQVNNGTTNGKIGIHTNLPTATLDVNGNARIRILLSGSAADSVVTADTNGNLRRRAVADLNSKDWALSGNAGTDTAVNFLGTTDNKPLIFRSNNTRVGRLTTSTIALGSGASYIGSNNIAIGVGAGALTGTGNDNITIGRSAGNNLDGGGSNIMIGPGTNSNSPGSGSQLNIGNILFGFGVSASVGGTGNIGLFTNAPTAVLDVNGNARVRTLPSGTAADSIVTADASGNLRKRMVTDVAGTEWYTYGTTTDAGSNKSGLVYRNGGVAIGSAHIMLADTNIFIGGGTQDTIEASAKNGAILGGSQNKVTGSSNNAIAGGGQNLAGTGGYSFIGGGNLNRIDNFAGASVINGGMRNSIIGGAGSAYNNVILGGADNSIKNGLTNNSVIVGGNNNSLAGPQSVIVGGDNHTIASGIANAVIVGGSNLKIAHNNNVMIGDVGGIFGSPLSSTTINGFTSIFSGGYRFLTDRSNIGEGMFLVDAAGSSRLGVNTNAPSAPLDVNGGARVRTLPSGAATDSIVTTDANGNLRKRSASAVGGTEWYTYGTTTDAGSDKTGRIYRNGSTAIGTAHIMMGATAFIGGGNANVIDTLTENSATLAGYDNIVSGNNSAIVAGQNNRVLGNNSAILGGDQNVVLGDNALAGGFLDSAKGNQSLAMGYQNVSGESAVTFGYFNKALNNNSIGVGSINTITGITSVAMGTSNTNAADNAVTLGNNNSIAQYSNASVALGSSNVVKASASGAVALGNSNTISGSNAVALGNSNSSSLDNAIAMGYTNIASGNTSIAMGYSSVASGNNAIAMGNTDSASGGNAAVIGGVGNAAISPSSFIGGGNGNKIWATGVSADNNAIVGGYQNIIKGNSLHDLGILLGKSNIIQATNSGISVMVGGYSNSLLTGGTNSNHNTIIGGTLNKITGNDVLQATLMGGTSNTIDGASNAMVLGGGNLNNLHSGSVMTGDNSNNTVVSTLKANSFTGIFNGGYRFLTNRNDTTKGVFVNQASASSSTLDVRGSMRVKVTKISIANYTVAADDYFITVDGSTLPGTPQTITLPSAASNAGRRLIIRWVHPTLAFATGNMVVQTSTAAEKIVAAGASISVATSSQNTQPYLELICDGTHWYLNR